jgi:hypothetical protein
LRVQLQAPFAGRTLYDANRRDPVQVLDPTSLLRPSALPSGYASTGRLTLEDASPNARGAYALRSYPGRKQASIEIYQGAPRSGPGPTGDGLADIEVVRSRPTVRGHPGVVHQARGFDDVVCLRWRERRDLVVSVCSRGNPAPLTAAQLVSIADGLVLPRK